MANSYPTSLNNYTGAETLSAAGHAEAHNAYESKIGIGASTPIASRLLRGTGTGTSAWAQAVLTTDVTGTLPVANGGTGVTASTGTVAVVLSTSPTLVTPILGVATATSINKVAITAPASSATLTIADGKTLTVSNTITLVGTDGTTYTFPGATATIAGLDSTQTLSNKRITKRTVTVTQSATPTINTDNTDIAYITGLAQAITSMTTNLSGTPNANDLLWVSITDNGTARAITWGASFEASGNIPLPTTTVISTRLDVLFTWNVATSKWRCIAVS